MKEIKVIKKIAPELIDIVERRYLILKTINYSGPIGRRSLSNELGLKERTIRDEVARLKDEGLINIESLGMDTTEDGKKIIDELSELYMEIKGINETEEILRKLLNIKKVYIVPNLIEKNMISKDMGKIVNKILRDLLRDGDILGITGGNTMSQVTREIDFKKDRKKVLVIPARGGLGKDVNTQANSIAARVSEGIGGEYKLLYAPDILEEEALKILKRQKDIKESIDLIDNMKVLLFGIGRADTMAMRRNLDKEKIDSLLKKGAVAEAFGHYFDIKGKEIWEYMTIGLSLNKYKKLENVIGIAGGEEKAEAIMSISTLNSSMILITDELAARKILELKN